MDIASFALRNSRASGGRLWIRGVRASIPRSVLVLGLTVAAFAPANDALAAESRPEPGITQGEPSAPQSPVPEPTAPTDAATPPEDATPDPEGDPVPEGSAPPEDEADPPAAEVDGAPTPETETSEAPGESEGPSEQQSGAPTSGAGTPATEGTPPADDTVAAPPDPAQQAAPPTPDNGASAETSTQGERGETSAKAPPAPTPTEEIPAAAGSGPRSEGLVATVQNDGATGELAAQEVISGGALLTPLGSTFLYTGVGGESRTSSAVSRLRTKRTARGARVMAPLKKFPHRRVPPAPGVAAGAGGAPANSSSGIRHLAAFAPGFVLAGPDRAGRPLSRDATDGPVAFVSLIERPG